MPLKCHACGRCNAFHGQQRKTDEEVLSQVIQITLILNNIKVRQYKFLVHATRNRKLENLSPTGKINGKRAPGKQ